jgi:eukaryotic-like serine/threonine-protein kinase
MSEPDRHARAKRPDSLDRRIDAACDRFEAAWRAGERPRIEAALDDSDLAERPALLRELVALEIELRRGVGESPDRQDYRARFPDHGSVIDALFADSTQRDRRLARGAPQGTSGTSRNLLLGLLGLQNNFINRAELLAAFNAWVVDKSRSLGQLLLDRGALDATRLALLEALVTEHLKLHHHDPDESLAALSSIGSAQRGLEEIDDEDLQASLGNVGTAPADEEGDADATRTLAAASHDSPDGRFRIIRLHAKGGLGEVFLARDEELNREVALKRIQERFADDGENRARFVKEAEITGALEHPGIVPVYGLGHYAGGRPFYAMRFIKGNSLKDAITRFHEEAAVGSNPGEQTLAFRKLLGRFVDVCNAIEYAHNRGVLHRDLKPGNVMIGRYAETLVVDWGLAKVIGRQDESAGTIPDARERVGPPDDASATTPGSALGTPAFMSPEQAAGRLQDLGPASDIYSLGATLFCLLTGQAPFPKEDPEVVLIQVAAGAFRRPRQIDPSVPPALEAICLKAMSLQPADRYEAVKEMALDVERWMADEPVSVWREPWSKRARRWTRRHRGPVSAAAAALLMATLLGGAFATIEANRARDEASAVGRALDRADEFAADARLAWRDRLDASGWERAREAAQAAASRTTGRSPNALRRRASTLAASVDAERASAREDVELLERLAAVRAAKGALNFEANAEYRRLLAGRGLAVAPTKAAAAAHRPAKRLRDDPPILKARLASYLDDWALILIGRSQDLTSAAGLLALARELDPDAWRGRLRDAILQARTPESRAALGALARAPDVPSQPTASLATLASAVRTAGQPELAIELLSMPHLRLGDDPWIYEELGLALRAVTPPRVEDALRAFTAATTLRPQMGFELAMALRDSGRTAEAVAVLEEMAKRSPDPLYYSQLADIEASTGLESQSRASYTRAIAMAREAVKSRPDDAAAHSNLGLILRGAGDDPGAAVACREAVRLEPGLAKAHNNLALVLHGMNDFTGAIKEYREAIKLEPNLAEAHNNLGNALRSTGNTAAAVAAFQEAIRLKPDYAEARTSLGVALSHSGNLSGAAKEHREAIRLRPNLPEPHLNLGLALHNSGDLRGAIKEYREAIRLRPTYTDARLALGVGLYSSGDLPGAIKEYREALKLKPDYPEAYVNLGAALSASGDHDGAAKAYREAIRLRPGFTPAYVNLGAALSAVGDHVGAIKEYRHVIRLRPGSAEAHYNLGASLSASGDREGAVKEYREAIRLKPDFPQPYANLAGALQSEGRFDEAVEQYRRARDLAGAQAETRLPGISGLLQRAERLAGLAPRLGGVVRGEDQPKDNLERLDFAKLASDRGMTASAARLWAEALTQDPKLADERSAQHRYNAACAAALAASGKSHDDPPPDDAARAVLRKQAHDWLAAELVTWRRVVDDGDARARNAAAKALRHWQEDPDLAGVRSDDALTKLPGEQRTAWHTLWAEFDVLLKRAEVIGSKPSRP